MKNFILIFLTALGVQVMLTSCTAAPEIIAHRGASHFAPENTLASFRLAWEKKADGIEGDFYLTKDGKIICMHDPTTKRTTGVDLSIKESTYKQLRKLDAGKWKGEKWKGEHIPSMSEVLSVIPDDKKLYLEVKCGPEIIMPLKKEMAKAGTKPKQVTIISFNSKVIAESKKLMPECKALWLVGVNEKKGKLSPTIDEIVDTLKKIHADGLDVNAHPLIDKTFVDKLRSNNFAFCIWTVNDLKTAAKFEKLGVDAITTDNPELLKEKENKNKLN